MSKETELSDEQIADICTGHTATLYVSRVAAQLAGIRAVIAADRALRQSDARMTSEDFAELYRLREAVKGPGGFATWQDAATDERIKRVNAQAALAAKDVDISALTAERDALKVDAARYRWLRVSTDCDVYVYSGSEFRNESLQRESLDAYTDAAIAKEKAK